MASRVDLRGLYPPVRDQGKRGTCVSFATTASHEQHRGQGEELSPEFLHWAAKTLDGVPHTEGTTLRAAAEALANLGQAGESLWHYDERRDQFVALYQPPAAARTDALTRCWTRGGAIPSGVAELRAALDAGRSPVLAAWPVRQCYAARWYAWWGPPSTGNARPLPAAPPCAGVLQPCQGCADGAPDAG